MKELAKKNIGERLSLLSLAFFMVSFVGWGHETLLSFLMTGRFCDRGFLHLPFCPIYGGPVCGTVLLLGTPKEGRLASAVERFGITHGLSEGVCRVFRYVLYYLLSGLFATAIELIVGLICNAQGLSLWSYDDQPFNFQGVICLSVSLFWGLALTLFARFVMPFIYQLLKKIPRKGRLFLNFLLWTALLFDFGYTSLNFYKLHKLRV